MKRLLFSAAAPLIFAHAAAAQTKQDLCNGANIGSNQGSQACPNGNPAGAGQALLDRIGTITNLLLFIAGAAAVLVIIYGGIRYITSTGDAARIKAAKDTIVYAVIGLVFALLAFAIVNFVLTNIK